MNTLALIAAWLVFAPLSVHAHGDEDHGAAPPAVSQTLAPRAIASSGAFEAVAVLEGRQLLLYLDRFASNEPVAGAKVEIEGAGLQGVAAETSPGVYAMDAASITPARHALTIFIDAGDSADLLSVTLDVAPPPADAVHAKGWQAWFQWLAWLGAGVLGILGLVALLPILRRKQAKGGK